MSRKAFFAIGIVLLLLAIADLILWIIISSDEKKSFESVVNEYVNIFPKSIANPATLTLLNIIALGIAIISFLLSASKSQNLKFKRLCLGLIIFSGFLAAWNLFSLM